PEKLPAFLSILPWLAAAILVCKWTMAARTFHLVYRQQLYTRQHWTWLLALWLALTIGVSFSAVLACAANQIPIQIVLFLAVWLLPGGELARCAANLVHNRHG